MTQALYAHMNKKRKKKKKKKEKDQHMGERNPIMYLLTTNNLNLP
jgi:hypothetical protein